MADYNISAVGQLRLYIWDKLKEYNILDENDYIADGFDTPLIPIIPSQQIPEFNNLIGDKPYIVYTFNVGPYGDEWWVCEESVVFSIVSSDYGKIIEITQFLADILRRMDETALEINTWANQTTKFKFFSSSLTYISSPLPFDEEGGRQFGEIEFTYKYSRFLDSGGRFQ